MASRMIEKGDQPASATRPRKPTPKAYEPQNFGYFDRLLQLESILGTE